MISRLSQQRLGACGLAAALSLFALSASVQATQTVNPTLTAGGASINGTTQAVPAGSTFTFYGMYTDDSASPESGLGLKVKYNGLHLTNVTVSEEYTKCRIARAQYPAGNVPPTNPTATDQVVMGWIDTSVRTAPIPGAVGWPDMADTVGGAVTTACLNPGTINTDFAAGTSVAPGQKLFKVTATMAASCTSAGACTSQVLFDSEGNFSYATSPSGFTNKSFTINGAAAPTQSLAAVPYLSRKTHGAAGTFDIAIDPTGSATVGTTITVEPRVTQSGSHKIIVAFATGVDATQFPTVSALAGATPLPVATSFSGSEMIVTIGDAGTPVPNGSRVVVNATGQGAAAGVNPNVVVGFLLGDVNGNRAVNSTDASQVRGQNLIAVTSANFKNDVNVNGSINSTDASLTRGQNLQTLP